MSRETLLFLRDLLGQTTFTFPGDSEDILEHAKACDRARRELDEAIESAEPPA